MKLLLGILFLTFISCKTQHLNLNSESLNGKYVGIGKINAGIELRLTDNNEFKFWIRKGHSSDFTQGTWENSNDTLILNSKTLNGTDSLTYALSSATWIVFKNSEWKINENKLTEIKNGKWKLKKAE
tara:strand:+ start:822 stop:1202 length:381 start_codon:yes stop_codon:yes gene_type:complete